MLDPTAKRKSIKEARGDRDAQQQFSAGTVGVDKGAGWHEQLNYFLMKHVLSVLHRLQVEAMIDRAKQQHIAVTVHHLA